MKILLIGNICSGKSMIGTLLSSHLNLPFHSLDQLRCKWSDGSVAGEYRAYTKLITLIEEKISNITEFSGVGIHKHSIRYALKFSRQPYCIIWVKSSESWNLEKKRQINQEIPFPFIIDLLSQIPNIAHELKIDWDNNFWKLPSFPHLLIQFNNETNNSNQDEFNFHINNLIEKLGSFFNKIEE